MIEIYAWNTKFLKIGDIVKRKAKLIEISPLAGQKKTKAKVLLNNFPVVYLDHGQKKLTEIKKNFDEGE